MGVCSSLDGLLALRPLAGDGIQYGLKSLPNQMKASVFACTPGVAGEKEYVFFSIREVGRNHAAKCNGCFVAASIGFAYA